MDDRRLRRALRGRDRRPVYHTNSPEECAYVLAHSRCPRPYLEDAVQREKIARCETSSRARHVVHDGEVDGAPSLADLRGAARPGRRASNARATASRARDAATIVYTSGTTGPPKGCVLTHANLLHVADVRSERDELSRRCDLHVPSAGPLAGAGRRVGRPRLRATLVVLERRSEAAARRHRRGGPTHFPSVPRCSRRSTPAMVSRRGRVAAFAAALFRLGDRDRRRRARRDAGGPAGRCSGA